MARSWTLSQAGQDQWIFGEAFNEAKNRYFLDVGAHDGINISNTYVLEHRYGWTGLCIEANPTTYQALRRNRRSRCINICLDKSDGEVAFVIRDVFGGIVAPDLDNSRTEPGDSVIRIKTKSLVNVLIEESAPRIIDYLSIDVEGAEERILESFDFSRYRFNCITIERPSTRLRNIFHEHGYIIVKEIFGLDCFYVHSEFMAEYTTNLHSFYMKKHLFFRWFPRRGS